MKQYWLAFIAVFATGCMLDPLDKDNLPVWSTTLEIPLIQTEITLEGILEDSLISAYPTGEDSDQIYVFNKTVNMERVEVGNRMKIDPIKESFVQYASDVTVDSSTTTLTVGYDTVGLDDIIEPISAEMGLIELDNIDPEQTAPFLFSEIMPPALVTSIENAIDAAGGSANVVVDTVALFPQQKPLSFDSFNSADVSSGLLDVTIINNMFIPLGAPIDVDVRNSVGAFIFKLTWDTEIAPGDSSTRSKDIGGLSLPGDLLIEVSGTSNGSQGELITVTSADLNSSFRIRAEAREIQVTQTDAIVPEQTITDTSTIALEPSETVVEEAVLLSGELNIAITNNLPLTGNARLTIPSLYHDTPDSVFEETFALQLGTFAIPASDLTGWTMTMDFYDQQLDYNYRIITDDTDPAYVIMDQFDNVDLDLAITHITFSDIKGQIEEQTNIDSGEIDIESDSRIQSASISEGHLRVGITNGIGGEADVRLTVPELSRMGSSLDTVLTVGPGVNQHMIGLSGYYVVPRSLDDQRLTYRTETVTRSGIYTYDLLDSIYADINLSELTFDAVTGYIIKEDIVEEDDIELDSETKVETAVIDSGEIQLTIQNFIGLEADVLIEISEMTKGDSGFTVSLPVTSSTEPVLETVDISGYSLSLPLDDQRIHYISTLRITSDELLSLTLEDSITVDVLIDTLRFTSVAGIIDTVEVEIDTVEQEISTLPEEMDGFDFTDVELTIEFDSDITIPVFLDLALEARTTDGELATTSVSNWNITDSASVSVPNGADLFSIRPDRILVYGLARVGGEGVFGTVTSNQSITGMLAVRAPLELEIGPDALITTDPYMVTEKDAEETVAEEIEEVLVFIHYDNQLEFGTSLSVFMSQDTLGFLDDGTAHVLVDSLVLSPNESGLDSLVLNDERLDLFNQDSMYIQARLGVVGQTDQSGQPIPSRFLSTDTLRLNLYGRLQYLVDGAELAGKTE
ncbi:MAG: hypothetical protein JSU77_10215 [Fidelibacterota bacterium]|nr:MAG: hypothetical protein JSU77_10215 [Candidatus Neomarinimicrobiota bacterium]